MVEQPISNNLSTTNIAAPVKKPYSLKPIVILAIIILLLMSIFLIPFEGDGALGLYFLSSFLIGILSVVGLILSMSFFLDIKVKSALTTIINIIALIIYISGLLWVILLLLHMFIPSG